MSPSEVEGVRSINKGVAPPVKAKQSHGEKVPHGSQRRQRSAVFRLRGETEGRVLCAERECEVVLRGGRCNTYLKSGTYDELCQGICMAM